MVFGVNDVNNETKSVIIKHNLGISKVILPHQDTNDKPPTSDKSNKPTTSDNFNNRIVKQPQPVSKKHETNLAVVTVVASGLAWYMFR